MKIIFLGAPGSGKGTQSRILQKKYSIPQLSSGDMLREEVSSASELGDKLYKIMSSGELVDDKTIIDLIERRIERDDCKDGFILDGFPRTVSQAESLDKRLESEGGIDFIISMNLNDNVIIERVSGRFNCVPCGAFYHDTLKPTQQYNICDECNGKEFLRRDDDNANAISARLKAHHENSKDLLEYYEKTGLLQTVNAMQDIDIIAQEISDLVSAKE